MILPRLPTKSFESLDLIELATKQGWAVEARFCSVGRTASGAAWGLLTCLFLFENAGLEMHFLAEQPPAREPDLRTKQPGKQKHLVQPTAEKTETASYGAERPG